MQGNTGLLLWDILLNHGGFKGLNLWLRHTKLKLHIISYPKLSGAPEGDMEKRAKDDDTWLSTLANPTSRGKSKGHNYTWKPGAHHYKSCYYIIYLIANGVWVLIAWRPVYLFNERQNKDQYWLKRNIQKSIVRWNKWSWLSTVYKGSVVFMNTVMNCSLF